MARPDRPGIKHPLFALCPRNQRKIEMPVAHVEGNRAVARPMRREDQPRPLRQEMPDRGGRPFGHDDRIELPPKGQGIDQHRQTRVAEEAYVAEPARQPLLAYQGDAWREARKIGTAAGWER